jgi:hypothetical protein
MAKAESVVEKLERILAAEVDAVEAGEQRVKDAQWEAREARKRQDHAESRLRAHKELVKSLGESLEKVRGVMATATGMSLRAMVAGDSQDKKAVA